jgi:hypothetical protein
MSVEIRDKLKALLSDVEGFKTKETELKAEKQCATRSRLLSQRVKRAAAMANSMRFVRTSYGCAARWMVCVTSCSLVRMRKLSRWMKRTYRLKESTLQKANANVPGRIARSY